MQDNDSSAIIQKAANGDLDSFGQVVEKYQGFVYAVAFRFLNNGPDAEDVTQEVFLQLWRKIHTYRKEIKLTTWLYKIIANRCMDVLKSANYRMSRGTVPLQSARNTSDSPDIIFQQTEFMKLVRDCANELTIKQKAVFLLRDVEGLEVAEVSDILNMSMNNIKANLYHARKRMAELLESKYTEKKESV